MPNSGTDPKKQPIVFFGTEDFSLTSLKGLVEHGFNVVAVVTKPDARKGRGQKMVEPRVKTYAKSQNIPVWQPKRLSDITDDIKSLQPVTGVLVAFGRIIPQATIDLFEPGIINVHPSLLPLYRGPSPVEAAIANRDAVTGVSIMQLTAEMDAGPVYVQIPYALDQKETKPELYNTLWQIGTSVLIEKLPNIIDGSLQPEPQDDSEATYCQLLDKADNLIDTETMTPGEAEARIRAHLGFPRTRIVLDGREVIVTKAHVVMTAESPLDIPFANGAYLHIDELVNQNGKTINGADYLNGRKNSR